MNPAIFLLGFGVFVIFAAVIAGLVRLAHALTPVAVAAVCGAA